MQNPKGCFSVRATRFESLRRALIAAAMLAAASRGFAEDANHLPAFPGAEGFGALATGGRGGEVYHVTHLKDHGPGSFRDAVSKGRRIVVFDVGGAIALESEVKIESDLTIAGQTAPGQGICLENYTVSLANSHNVIARYFRVRQGLTHRTDKKCALSLYESENVIVDHVSIEWGRWDCIGFVKANDVTVQNCIIGEGVDPQRFGCLCESDNVTFSHNLWIDNQSRNPKADGTIQYINNVVYNWGGHGYVGGHSAAVHTADVIGNYFIKGPSSAEHFAGELTQTDHLFLSGNYADLDRDGQLNGKPIGAKEFADATFLSAPALQAPVPVVVDSAPDACRKVLADAGDAMHRDAIDTRLLEQARSLGKSGAILKDPAEIGGFGEIPPSTGRAIAVTNPNGVATSGYTNLEQALNVLVPR